MRRLCAVLAAAATLLGAGCGGGLQFAQDGRLRITSPQDLATVSTPIHVRWSTAVSSTYAVFVDSLPVHPGQNLRSLAGRTCGGVPTCIDVAWLNRHFVYLTNQPSLDLDTLPILGPPKGERDVHKVTIILVDGDWRRIGEAAWSVTFGLRHLRSP